MQSYAVYQIYAERGPGARKVEVSLELNVYLTTYAVDFNLMFLA